MAGNVNAGRANRGGKTASLFRRNDSARFRTNLGHTFPINIYLQAPGESVTKLGKALLNAMHEEVDGPTLSSYAFSYLFLFFPHLADVIKAALGNSVKFCSSAAEKMAGGLTISESIKPELMLPNMGQIILLFYKNIKPANYDNYMLARIKGLASNCSATEDDLFPIVDADGAAAMREYLGSIFMLKKSLFRSVLNTAKLGMDPISQICSYCTGMLEFTDMAHITFIQKTLIVQRSPVLNHPSVRNEVLNLYLAFKEIEKCDIPLYYKLITAPEEARVVERNKFNVLSAVGQTLQAEIYPNVANFVSCPTVSSKLVERLLKLHREQIGLAETSAGWILNRLLGVDNAGE